MVWLVAALPAPVADAAAQPQGEGARLEVVARIRPFDPVLLAGTSAGGLWLWQADPRHREAGPVRRLEAGSVVMRETELSPRRVARQLGLDDDQPPGAFVGIAGDESRLWFLWRGQLAGRTAAVLGRYDAASRQVTIDSDAQTLADALDIQSSLVLTELELHRSGETLWLRTRDLDRARLFHRPLGGFGLGGAVQLRAGDGAPGGTGLDLLPDLRSDSMQLGPGPDDGLVITNRQTHDLWLIDAQGRTRWVASLAGLPQGITPAVSGPQGRLVAFAADTARSSGRLGLLEVNFPAVVVLEPGEHGYHKRYHDRDALAVADGYPLYAVQLDRLAPAGAGRYYGFHRATGEVMRLSVATGEGDASAK